MNKRFLRLLLEVAETLVLTVVIFLVLENFVAQPFRVEGTSMERTLEPEQYVLIDKLSPRVDPYKRGDIIVLTPPSSAEMDAGVPFIKRIIGLPGDLLQLRDGSVYVNGSKLLEAYTYDLQPTQPISGETSWTVPEGEVFVMGDHREASNDSRAFGPVLTSAIIGRAFLRYWPLSSFGILPRAAYALGTGT